jgi:putative ABC transport system ATP-binding protein
LSRYRNRRVGFVFQSFNLHPHETALENVMMPLVFARVSRKKRQARARVCLEAVGLGDRARHRPAQLSGGQRQRVAIARALVTRPSIIIADEPTGNLDSARGSEIIALLARLNREDGVTLLVITHDDHIARQADRILTISDGRISERRS